MDRLRVWLAGGCLLAATVSLSGCQLFPHWMQPSQLWKMNRQPAWDESAFSVPDPGPARTEHEQVSRNVTAPELVGHND
jgi:hypothetical protein